jgi:hypothetical protein
MWDSTFTRQPLWLHDLLAASLTPSLSALSVVNRVDSYQGMPTSFMQWKEAMRSAGFRSERTGGRLKWERVSFKEDQSGCRWCLA